VDSRRQVCTAATHLLAQLCAACLPDPIVVLILPVVLLQLHLILIKPHWSAPILACCSWFPHDLSVLSQFAKVIGSEWREMSEDDKKPYADSAAILKEEVSYTPVPIHQY